MIATLKTYSPVDNSLYVEREYANQEEIKTALSKAQVAKKLWSLSSLAERQEYCLAAVNEIVACKVDIAEEICWQMGRPIRYAAGEINGFEERARYMIAQAESSLASVELPEKEGFTRYIKREPLGLVLVIAPWNYPYLTAVNAIIPALMAGNVVILKHSAQTPLVAERFDQAFKKAGLPMGVFQYLHLTHEDTEQLMRSPAVNSVAFTGSVAGGERVEQTLAGRFIPVNLELGGKDPAYIRADADLDHAVETVIDGAFFNSGQSCCGIERIYVHKEICEQFVNKAVNLVKQYKLGRPDDPETTLGPLVRASSADFVREQIKEAIAQGAVAHINTQDFVMDRPGTPYLAPQILTDVNHRMRIMTEETFGPVVGIMSVDSDEEAIERMNDSDYGLTAAVFTQDIHRGIAIGERLQTGTFFINRCDYLDPGLAWTGVKKSGRGCTLSAIGYEYLTRPKSFHIRTKIET
ncbi:TPA: aldehyde dehydrogenase family protein [Legionella pneumophila]|uniref:aldehyde dehydrogenase family protein n=1 Tax=Legionella pneumophila TaxID=446 RepID=UPI000770761C|nr:aldehyde dehydrogenase family protein [Legionella pneumophila]AMQ28534.1 aldehyde dehydrogenase [Legionella pneumophila subsp. pneumophila]MBN5928085.1 aldehyde dehydrogenase family protein [Legionella pneumophila]MCH9060754.1 aldehyde dehydrogenase family protein [Legionella pneumophila serogroup 1]MCH9063456.1 aldehyde dehydrogenase family protein [Legionella pneumophila serogroup 1]MCH9066504.1 aldehyde dehydrogenase family protein [Legionella pneumophila serogroup 1]